MVRSDIIPKPHDLARWMKIEIAMLLRLDDRTELNFVKNEVCGRLCGIMLIVVQAQFSFPSAPEWLASERCMRAASDLLGRMHNLAPRRIAYLEVGSWSIRTLLAQRFPDTEIVSFNASGAGRAKADEFDLIFSNCDLDLLPSLRELLPVLVTRLSFGGSLAVQIPDNLYEPNRALLRMVAADGRWAKKLLPVAKTRPFNEMMESLYGLLCPVCASVEIWETTYLYAFDGVGAIIDFMKATSLPPFLRPLDEPLRRRFLDCYVTELTKAYPAQPDGKVLLRFPRILLLAQR